MKTAVIMKRDLFGNAVSQNSKTGFFSETELVKAGNAWRTQKGMPIFNAAQWYRTKGVAEFVRELEKQFGTIRTSTRGRNGQTWIHPYLLIDMALAMNPAFKVTVYKWLYDSLLEYRNISGDSYKKMAGAIYERIGNKQEMPRKITEIAKRIREEVGAQDWETATERQLRLRDKIHEYAALLTDVLRDVDTACDVAICKAKEEIGDE